MDIYKANELTQSKADIEEFVVDHLSVIGNGDIGKVKGR
jgi:hypothetical protein